MVAELVVLVKELLDLDQEFLVDLVVGVVEDHPLLLEELDLE
jgi:hypothetical protein